MEDHEDTQSEHESSIHKLIGQDEPPNQLERAQLQLHQVQAA